MAHADCARGLVSVIMPSFNHEAFVAEAMQSVFDQSYGDIEFLIVDDCSSDTTAQIIQAMAKNARFRRRFRRLMFTRNQRNIGAHQSLNSGLAEARGEFITFINSDDVFERDRLRTLVAACHARNAPFLAFSAVQLIDASGNRVRRHELKELLELGPKQFAASLPSVSFGFLRYQLAASTGNIFVNRALLAETGGFRPLQYCHDWDFMLRAITLVEPCHVPQTAYKYRIHASNTFSRLQDSATDDAATALGCYFSRITSGDVRNRLAPTPENWPFVFETIVKRFDVYDMWLQQAHYSPYYATRQRTLADATQPGPAGLGHGHDESAIAVPDHTRIPQSHVDRTP